VRIVADGYMSCHLGSHRTYNSRMFTYWLATPSRFCEQARLRTGAERISSHVVQHQFVAVIALANGLGLRIS
jgi:hypothetical protein